MKDDLVERLRTEVREDRGWSDDELLIEAAARIEVLTTIVGLYVDLMDVRPEHEALVTQCALSTPATRGEE